MKTLILFLLLLPSLAFGGDWDKTEKALYSSYFALEVADCLQTRDIMSNPKYREMNPIIRGVGYKYAVPYSVIEALGVAYLSDKLPHKWRKGFLILATGINVYCVSHNYHIGVKFKF